MIGSDHKAVLTALPFFRGIENAEAERLISRIGGLISVKEYAAGESVDPGRAVCIVISGEADIAVSKSNPAVIRTVGSGDMFGAGMVYGAVHPETYAMAKTRTTALLIPQRALDVMIAESPAAAKNYIAMLSDKISFLNRRIATFTATDAEEKVALYLYGCAVANGSYGDTFTLNEPYTAVAKKLDMGRASLYRTLDGLVDAGIINRDGSVITILKLDELLKISER